MSRQPGIYEALKPRGWKLLRCVGKDEFARRCALSFSTPLRAASFFVKHYVAINFTDGSFPPAKIRFLTRFFFGGKVECFSINFLFPEQNYVSPPHWNAPTTILLRCAIHRLKNQNVNTQISTNFLVYRFISRKTHVIFTTVESVHTNTVSDTKHFWSVT